jgi:hypothetical protein
LKERKWKEVEIDTGEWIEVEQQKGMKGKKPLSLFSFLSYSFSYSFSLARDSLAKVERGRIERGGESKEVEHSFFFSGEQ